MADSRSTPPEGVDDGAESGASDPAVATDGDEADGAGASDAADPTGAGAASGASADGEEAADTSAADEGDSTDTPTERSTEALRRDVEERYDFEDFGPEDMAQMSAAEWEAAFDPETWITGDRLIDRVEADLKSRISSRDVFARIERAPEIDGLVAYSDEGYAVVYPDGSVEGRGTVRRDVEPTVALCSMDDYEVPEITEENPLPDPEDVPEGTGELGNWMLQAIAASQLLAGLALVGVWLFGGVATVVAPVAGLAFLVFALFLFLQVANARLSDGFRAEEYRSRLRAIETDAGARPEIPELDGRDGATEASAEAGRERAGATDEEGAETTGDEGPNPAA